MRGHRPDHLAEASSLVSKMISVKPSTRSDCSLLPDLPQPEPSSITLFRREMWPIKHDIKTHGPAVLPWLPCTADG